MTFNDINNKLVALE